MSGTLDEFRGLLVELTDADSDFGEPMTIVTQGVTAASFGIGTAGSATVTYDAASGGYVSTAPVEGSGGPLAAETVETAFRGILLDVTKQPRVSDEAVQAGIATVVCPVITRSDNTNLAPVVGNYVRTSRGSFQVIAVSPIHVQGGSAGWRLVLGS